MKVLVITQYENAPNCEPSAVIAMHGKTEDQVYCDWIRGLTTPPSILPDKTILDESIDAYYSIELIDNQRID